MPFHSLLNSHVKLSCCCCCTLSAIASLYMDLAPKMSKITRTVWGGGKYHLFGCFVISIFFLYTPILLTSLILITTSILISTLILISTSIQYSLLLQYSFSTRIHYTNTLYYYNTLYYSETLSNLKVYYPKTLLRQYHLLLIYSWVLPGRGDFSTLLWICHIC